MESLFVLFNCFVWLFCSDFSQEKVAGMVILDKLLTKGKDISLIICDLIIMFLTSTA